MSTFLKNFKILNSISKGLIVIYQATVSYFFGGNCRYYPSCSHYAKQAFETHTFFSASKLTFFRLLSCHPLSKKNYYDPVPQNKFTADQNQPRPI